MSLDMYKIPQEHVGVEALVQEFFRYHRITMEDTEYVCCDRDRRDKVIAELRSKEWFNQWVPPDVTSVEHIVAHGDDPDKYLVPVNAEVAKLTPPKTFEDRVLRLRLASAAFLVWSTYKVYYALADHQDLMQAIIQRKDQLLDEWLQGEYLTLFPYRARRTIPSKPRQPITPLAPQGPTKLNIYAIDQLLDKPNSLVGKQFLHTAPKGEDEDDNGTWQVVSYSVRRGEEGQGVVEEYELELEAYGTAPIPMHRKEVQKLLVNSMPVM